MLLDVSEYTSEHLKSQNLLEEYASNLRPQAVWALDLSLSVGCQLVCHLTVLLLLTPLKSRSKIEQESLAHQTGFTNSATDLREDMRKRNR